VREPDGSVRYVVDENASKRLGTYVNPPLETEPVSTVLATPAAPAAPGPRAAPQQKGTTTYAVASAETREAPPPAPRQTQPSGNMFTSLFSSNEATPPPPPARQDSGMMGRVKSFFVGDDKPSTTPSPRPAKQAKPTPKQQKPEPAQATAAPTPATTTAPAPTSAPANASLLNGAQPTVPTGSFDQRFGAIR